MCKLFKVNSMKRFKLEVHQRRQRTTFSTIIDSLAYIFVSNLWPYQGQEIHN